MGKARGLLEYIKNNEHPIRTITTDVSYRVIFSDHSRKLFYEHFNTKEQDNEMSWEFSYVE